MKIFVKTQFVFLFCLIFFCGCRKKIQNKKLSESCYKLALLEAEDQNYKKAIDYIDQSIKEYENPVYLALKGTFLFKIGCLDDGGACFKEALNNVIDQKVRADILNNQACLLAQLGFEKNYDAFVRQALNIWSDLEKNKDYMTPEVALFNKSKVYFLKNDFDKSCDCLKRAINLSPNYVDAHFYFSLLAYRNDDLFLAKRELSTVLFLEPTHEGALKLMNDIEKSSLLN